jgi:hypothetical protein
MPGVSALLLVAADPDRRILIISGDGQNIITVAPNPSVTAQNGIQLTNITPVYTITWDTHGPLVALAWYAVSTGIANVWALTQAMRKDPRDHGFASAYLDPTSIPERVPPIPRRTRQLRERQLPHRSGIYPTISRRHPALFDD